VLLDIEHGPGSGGKIHTAETAHHRQGLSITAPLRRMANTQNGDIMPLGDVCQRFKKRTCLIRLVDIDLWPKIGLDRVEHYQGRRKVGAFPQLAQRDLKNGEVLEGKTDFVPIPRGHLVVKNTGQVGAHRFHAWAYHAPKIIFAGKKEGGAWRTREG
jgi:hypothetical protein